MCLLDGTALAFQQALAECGSISAEAKLGAVMWPSFVEGELQRFAFRFLKADTSLARAADVRVDHRGLNPAEVARLFVTVYNEAVYCGLSNGEFMDPEQVGVNARREASADAGTEGINYMLGAGVAEVVNEDAAASPISALAFDRAASAPAATLRTISASDPRVTRGAHNCCFADAVSYSRAIVAKKTAGGAGGDVTFAAHRYNEAGFVPATTADEFIVKDSHLTAPAEAVLINAERHLLLRDENETKLLSRLDMETGTVVQRYGHQEDVDIKGVTELFKGDGGASNLIACRARNSVFAIDTRLEEKKCVVLESGKGYSDYALSLRQPESFTCHATSAKGHLAVGNLTGEVRLFSGVPGSSRPGARAAYHPKSCKTLLPAAPGFPVRGLDVTADGNYVLVTCDKFVLLLCVAYEETAGTLCGFESRMGAKKPFPLRLELSPEQVASVGGPKKVQFTRATFEFNPASQESWICASVGPCLVSWSFDAAKRELERAARRPFEGTVINEGAGDIRQIIVKGGGSGGAGGAAATTGVKFMTDEVIRMERPQVVKTIPKSGKVRFEF
jgi:hypothetical protein